MASKVPSWVERMLIPTLETKIRTIVAEELAKYGKTVDVKFEAVDARFESINSNMDARFGALDSKMEAKFEAVNARLDSLEERLDVVKEIAEIKARLGVIEKQRR
jgi:tetrahydromethanopterin S-methyltransferase subunit G